MEENSIGKSTSFKEASAHSESIKNSGNGAKRRRSSLNSKAGFWFTEIYIDPGVKSLKHLDSAKIKDEIKKWAKAIAEQVDGSRQKENYLTFR